MKPKFRFLMLPCERRLRFASRMDEASLFGCDIVFEVRAFTYKRGLTASEYTVMFVGDLGWLMESLTKDSLTKLGLVTCSFSDFQSDWKILEIFPIGVRTHSLSLRQLSVVFGTFGKRFTADRWHDDKFVDAVGRSIGYALAATISDQRLSNVGFSLAHSSETLINRASTGFELACRPIYKCSLVSHEKELFKSILNGCLSALSERSVQA